MSEQPPQYQIGQIVNGHRWTGTVWEPVGEPGGPQTPGPPSQPTAVLPEKSPAPDPQLGPPAEVPATGRNGLATAGFVLGLLGLLGSWIPLLNILAIVLGVVGAILAAVGLGKSKKAGVGKGLALAGLILGVLAVIIALVVNAAFVNSVDDAIDTTTDTTVEAPADSADDAASDADAAAGEELGTTRDNPAPLGSAITGGDWTVTINSVKTADEDSIGQKPEAGSTLLVVNVTATYNGDDEQGASAWANVKFVTADGTTIDSTSGSTLFLEDDSFDSLKTVYGGASVTGDKMLEVPSDGWKKGVLAVSPDLLSDDTFVEVQ